MNPKPTTGFAIVLPDGRLVAQTHMTAKEARDYAHMYRAASDPDRSWKRCYQLGYRVIPVHIVPRRKGSPRFA